MKLSILLATILCVVFLHHNGCIPATEAEVMVMTTGASIEIPGGTPGDTYPASPTPLTPAATPTLVPTQTPFPTNTPANTPSPPRPTKPALLATIAETPSATPTLYPHVWAAGLLWDEARTILFVGSSSGMVFDSRITYEPLNEQVAETIARIPVGALVVFYGDYRPDGPREGLMVVKRAEQVNLPYDEETPLTAVYAHPDNLFSFAYPEGWSLTIESDGDTLTLLNRPPQSQQYMGPGIEYVDPTTIWLTIKVANASLEEYVLRSRERERVGADVPDDQQLLINVSQQEFNGMSVTLIDEERVIWGTTRQYVVPLNERKVLVFTPPIEDAHFVQRLLTTLSIGEVD